MNNRHLFILCIVVFIFSFYAFAGVEGNEVGEFSVKYLDTNDFPLNYVYYTVKDKNGNYADSINEDFLRLKENGTEEKVFKIENDTKTFPAAVVLIIDSSGSMKAVMGQVRDAATNFIDKINENIKVIPIDFDSQVKVLSKLSNDRSMLKKSMESIKADGGTALYDAIKTGCDQLEGFKGFRAVLVLTDGKDENRTNSGPGSKIDLDTLKKVINPLNIPVYSIGLGNGVDESVLKDISRSTGGLYYHSKDPVGLNDIYRDIINFTTSLRRFYYITDNAAMDSSNRDVSIEVKYSAGIKGNLNYVAPFGKGFCYVFSKEKEDDLSTICNASISTDGKTIYVPEHDCLFTSNGKRIYGNLDWKDSKDSINTGEYIYRAGGNSLSGDLFKVEDNKLTEIDKNSLYNSINNDEKIPEENIGKQFIKAISRNGQYVAFFTRLQNMDQKYALTLIDLKNKKALYTNALETEGDQEPDMARVTDDGEVYLTVDHNLTFYDKEGNEKFSWKWNENGRRVHYFSITRDGSMGVAWLDMNWVDRSKAPKGKVILFDRDGEILEVQKTEELGQFNRVSISPDGKYYGFNSRKGPRVFRTSDEKLVFSIEEEFPKSDNENFIDIGPDNMIVYNIRSKICCGKVVL